MPLPDPEPGLVIPYGYLWRREHRRGQEEGRKTRPAVIVLVADTAKGATRVTVAAVTHSAPTDPALALEIPPRVKQALGLDAERSWIILDEVNQFDWPGFDIRPVAGDPQRFAYGFLPPRLFDAAIGRILHLAAERKIAAIPRD